MNVLVYSGPEVVQTSLGNCLKSLKSILTSYSVQQLSKQSLTSHPWALSCALLVIPECKQPPKFSKTDPISSFIDDGGSLLYLSAGVRYPRALHSDGTVSFLEKKTGLVLEPVITPTNKLQLETVLHETNGPFHVARDPLKTIQSPSQTHNTRVLYRYQSGDIASIGCVIGSGKVVFWTAALDARLQDLPEAANLDAPGLESGQRSLLTNTLQYLGLDTSKFTEQPVHHHPLPQFLLASPSRQGAIDGIILSIDPKSLGTFDDENDTFRLHTVNEGLKLLARLKEEKHGPFDPLTRSPRDIIVCRDGYVPSTSGTPLFDLPRYFNALSATRVKEPTSSWGMGDVLLYGEMVTSTQTMLEKNPNLLSSLSVPLVSLATHQLAGRGRGSNVWLSPSGCLQFSLLLRLSLSSFPANKLVFVQYLFALAVAEACSSDAVLGPQLGKSVRIKWPNDVYAMLGGNEVKKIGGILVNSSFSGGQVHIVIGSGLNVLNEAPIMSLSQISHEQKLSLEETAASILSTFETMWETFVLERGSFNSFMDRYLQRWLHSDQLVTLTTVSPPQKVRIVGITPDHGLLRTVPESNSGRIEFVDLQPDGNSFDLMSGMIKLKS